MTACLFNSIYRKAPFHVMNQALPYLVAYVFRTRVDETSQAQMALTQ